jgi:Domain of unknown function (DUF4337)
MSHGVHAVQHELQHEHGGAGKKQGADRTSKQVALLISVLALLLAFSETLGKAAQTKAISDNVETSNLWAFSQSKGIRLNTLRTIADLLEVEIPGTSDPALKAAKEKKVKEWRKAAERYDSDPQAGEGRKELQEQAREKESERDKAMAKYHNYEIASGALQIGIVLSSAAVITGMMVLAWIAGGLGIIGLALIGLGLFAPEAVHFF